MRRIVFALIALVGVQAPSARAVPPMAGGILASDNIEYVATIPDVNAVGAKIVGDYMYVTTVHGLRIYDVSGGLPVLTGALPMPHWENESVDTNGEVLLIAMNFRFFSGPFDLVAVIDVSNKRLPVVDQVLGSWYAHTATCVDDCRYVWTAGSEVMPLTGPGQGGQVVTHTVHNWNVDRAGMVWGTSQYGEESLLDTTRHPEGNPAMPVKVPFSGKIGWHSSMRPNATPLDVPTMADEEVDRGEVVLGSDEIWPGPCVEHGSFKTSWFHEVDGGYLASPLDSWNLSEGLLDEIEPLEEKPVTAMCSGHWFDYHEDLVAIAWYEQGTRILDVSNPRDIRQVGYFLPAQAETFAAYFHEVDDGPLGGGLYV